MRIVFFSICAKNYLPYARTLFASLARHQPGADTCLILSDRLAGAIEPAGEPFEIVEAEALGIDSIADMALRYDVTEFSTAIKPGCFEFLFRRGRWDAVVYLDPDIYVTSRLEEVEQRLAAGADAILTPHICAPVEDGEKPDDHSMLQAGIYNLGFLALRDAPESRRFVAWWHRRLLMDCRSDLAEGLYVDQKWAELLPCFVERASILRHPGYNVAYWNLMHRALGRREDAWTVNGEPLRFFHFSGIDFRQSNVFSKHQTRFTMRNIGEVRELADEYRREVMQNGWTELASLPYAFGTFSNGAAIPEVIRRLYREDMKLSNTPIEALHAEVIDYCNAVSRDVDHPEAPRLTNLMLKIWKLRPDLQQAFDLRAAEGYRAYLDWYLHSATRELRIDERFLGPLGSRPADGPPGETGPTGTRLARRRPLSERMASGALAHAHRLRSLYMRIPIPVRLRIKRRLLRLAYPSAARRSGPPGLAASEESRPGVQLIGYPRAELGMGEHVRLSALALKSVGFPFSIYDFSANVVARQQDDRAVEWLGAAAPGAASIFHINADQMPVFRDTLGAAFFEGRYAIGFWAWELSKFPDEWQPAIAMVDEIWAPSRFIRDSIAGKADRPVIWMPLAVHVEPPPTIARSYFQLPGDRFVFLFSFDFASYVTRKNPGGVIDAFQQAFARGDTRALLVVKVMAHAWHAAELQALKQRIAGDPRIRLLEGVLSHGEIAGLTACCDAFVSLHRSEGFGRGMAEAMHLGKPVVATAYSGNTDFTTEETACLVDYSLVPVKEGEYPFHEGQVWADPNVEQAARHMRRLVEDARFGAALGQRARRRMLLDFAPERVGARMRRQLEERGLG